MRLLHTIRVGDLVRSIKLCVNADEREHTALELTCKWGADAYEIGASGVHLAMEVGDVYQMLVANVSDPDGNQAELIGKNSACRAKPKLPRSWQLPPGAYGITN